MIGVDVPQQTVVGEDMVSGVLITSKFCLCEEPKATNPTQCLVFDMAIASHHASLAAKGSRRHAK